MYIQLETVLIAAIVFLSLTELIVFQLPSGTIITIYMAFLPFLLLLLAPFLFRCNKSMVLKMKWLLIFMMYLILVVSLNYAASKPTSIIYTFILVAFFILIYVNIDQVKTGYFIKTFQVILILYFVNLVLTQVKVLLGVNDPFLDSILKSIYEDKTDSIRYYSFSSEPSYAAFIVTTSYYAYYKLSRIVNSKPQTVYLVMMFYCVALYQSIYGYILTMGIILMLLMETKARYKNIAMVGAALLVFLLGSGWFASGERLYLLVQSLINGEIVDVDTLDFIDSSTWIRIAPSIEYFTTARFSDLSFLIGHGAASSTPYFSDLFFGHEVKGGVLQLGFVPAFVYDYGLIGASTVVLFISSISIIKIISLESLFIFLMFFNANFNTQLFWFLVLSFAIVKYSKTRNAPLTETEGC